MQTPSPPLDVLSSLGEVCEVLVQEVLFESETVALDVRLPVHLADVEIKSLSILG